MDKRRWSRAALLVGLTLAATRCGSSGGNQGSTSGTDGGASGIGRHVERERLRRHELGERERGRRKHLRERKWVRQREQLGGRHRRRRHRRPAVGAHARQRHLPAVHLRGAEPHRGGRDGDGARHDVRHERDLPRERQHAEPGHRVGALPGGRPRGGGLPDGRDRLHGDHAGRRRRPLLRIPGARVEPERRRFRRDDRPARVDRPRDQRRRRHPWHAGHRSRGAPALRRDGKQPAPRPRSLGRRRDGDDDRAAGR